MICITILRNGCQVGEFLLKKSLEQDISSKIVGWKIDSEIEEGIKKGRG